MRGSKEEYLASNLHTDVEGNEMEETKPKRKRYSEVSEEVKKHPSELSMSVKLGLIAQHLTYANIFS